VPAPTVPVTVRLYSGEDGSPYVGVRVTARLDKNDAYEGFIISERVSEVTDATGTAVLNLFPNDTGTGLGTTGSTWVFRARPSQGLVWDYSAQIPNEACNLDDLANLTAVPPGTPWADAVRSTVLTGLSLASSAAVSAADTVLGAIGKLQAKWVALSASGGSALVGYGTQTVEEILDSHRSQATASAGIADNVIHGHSTNAVASDISGAAIAGGGQTGYNNVIGGDGSATVGTATPNAASTGTGANYSAIMGGYDNVAGGLASIITGFHNYTGTSSTHGTLSGGSYLKVTAGDYNTISGGTLNEIGGGGSYATIGGGGSHVITLAAGQNGATIAGGFDNTVTARNGTVGGGALNTASGIAATVSGGQVNTASGAQSTVAGGDTNTAGGIASGLVGGYGNTLSATASRSDYSAGIGGYQNTLGATAAARFSGMLSGRLNTVNAEYAATIGGRECSVTGEAGLASGYGAKSILGGQWAHASGYFSAAGDAQTSIFIARRQTTDDTPTELRLNSTLGQRITIAVDTTWAFSILLVARRTDANDESAAYKFEGCIDRNTAQSPALVGSITKTVLAEDTAAWDADVLADTSNGALQILVTGEAAKTINWVARVTLVEVTG
jgi:hypothetical protein